MPHKIAHHRVRQKPKPKSLTATLARRAVLAIAVIEPLMTMPQIYQIWIKHETAGVSLITWGFYLFSAIVWTIYSIQIKDLPIFLSSSLWVLTEGMVVVGLLVVK